MEELQVFVLPTCEATISRYLLCSITDHYPLKVQDANGLGLQALISQDYCHVTVQYPRDTVPKWRDPKTGELEGLSFDFNLCEAVATWEQVSLSFLSKVRNSSTILTKEFIDALPNGWAEYAWRRINKGIQL
ncbi:hypothetical protein BHE74_00028548 [Ensete ventricosum]|nr:hypothetical protein BHE74_00028548 [Ensete ventricosum]RZS06308.1 hypothetical protein BHM03_00036941 [Ensete ventricosum]